MPHYRLGQRLKQDNQLKKANNLFWNFFNTAQLQNKAILVMALFIFIKNIEIKAIMGEREVIE
jgi:hypothetical protein